MTTTGFAERFGAINDVLNTVSLLQWDSRTMMPKGGVESRARQLGTMMGVARDMLLAADTRRAAEAALRDADNLAPDAPQRRAAEQALRAIDFHARIPASLQQRRAELRMIANAAWVEARAQSDFALFRPHLEQMVALTREYAEAIGYDAHPYDALVAQYEPGETVASLSALFARLRAGLTPILRQTAECPQPRADFLARDFPIETQRELALRFAARVGYDLDRGRLDTTIHPFEISFTRNDVRITTRFYRNFLPPSLFGALHEAGHGIYEQGVDAAYTRTPLATDLAGLYAVGGTSFGAHESQSRLYENHVGRSLAFWNLHFPELQAAFPDALADVDAASFHRAVNRIRPGFIRVEADEFTYDFHIMLRVEIEAALMDGSLAVADLPGAWRDAVRRELGIDVPNDAQGVLQDVHWSSGMIGSFCSYTIGNVMAAQLMQTARAADPAIGAGLESGDYAPLKAWLGANIHRHGRRFTRDELLVQAAGRTLDPAPYLAYLRAKAAEIYGIALA